MFRTVPLSIIRSFTLHTAMVYVIQDPARKLSAGSCMTYTIAVFTVKNS